jgi:uncharacterized membrane protein YfcA
MDSLLALNIFEWIQLIGLFAGLGIAAGFIAGLLGVGGGTVIVPGLVAIFTLLGLAADSTMHVCVGTSLAVIIFTGFSSARAHWKRGAVDMALVKRIGIGIVIGVVLAIISADIISGVTMKKIFAVAMALFGVLMLIDPAKIKFLDKEPGQPWSAISGAINGFFSTLVGVGGGALNVPYMSMCKVPMHRAIGSAAAMGLIVSIPAAIGFIIIGWDAPGRPPYSLGYVSIPAFLAAVPLTITSAKWGAWTAHKANVKLLRRVFSLYMFFLAVKMGLDAW